MLTAALPMLANRRAGSAVARQLRRLAACVLSAVPPGARPQEEAEFVHRCHVFINQYRCGRTQARGMGGVALAVLQRMACSGGRG